MSPSSPVENAHALEMTLEAFLDDQIGCLSLSPLKHVLPISLLAPWIPADIGGKILSLLQNALTQRKKWSLPSFNRCSISNPAALQPVPSKSVSSCSLPSKRRHIPCPKDHRERGLMILQGIGFPSLPPGLRDKRGNSCGAGPHPQPESQARHRL